jgi:hypothetical protein
VGFERQPTTKAQEVSRFCEDNAMSSFSNAKQLKLICAGPESDWKIRRGPSNSDRRDDPGI